MEYKHKFQHHGLYGSYQPKNVNLMKIPDRYIVFSHTRDGNHFWATVVDKEKRCLWAIDCYYNAESSAVYTQMLNLIRVFLQQSEELLKKPTDDPQTINWHVKKLNLSGIQADATNCGMFIPWIVYYLQKCNEGVYELVDKLQAMKHSKELMNELCGFCSLLLFAGPTLLKHYYELETKASNQSKSTSKSE